MIQIKPFKAFIPDYRIVEKLICPPYDVISLRESKEIAKKNGEVSLIHIIRSEVDFPDEQDPYDEKIYTRAKQNLEKFIKNRYFIQENQEVFYVYELIWKGKSQAGIVGLCHIQDYLDKKIKIHEHTRADKEEDRFKHIDITGFNCEPVFFCFRSSEHQKLEKFINLIKQDSFLLVFDILDEQETRHRIFRIKEKNEIQKIQQYFSELNYIYIADGHHRTASTVKAGLKRRNQDKNFHPEKNYNWFLSVIFPSQQLQILPYNRVIKDLNSLSTEDFLKKLQDKFIVTKSKETLQIHRFRMFLDRTWYTLELKKEFYRYNTLEDLDVSYLQDYILNPILGIEDPRTSKKIDFVGGIRGEEELEKLVLSGEYKVAFSLFPTPIENLFDAADANKVMPPKSTWFEPKLKSGFFLNKIDE